MTVPPVSNLLLADDDKDDRDLFYEALAELDPSINYRGVEDGQKALNHLSASLPVLPSVIFLDINMPIMNGWEVLRKLKSDNRYKSIPVIIYSTASGEREKRIAEDLGALCFVTKPDKYGLVKDMLEVVLAHVRDNKVSDETCREIHRVLSK
jgi:CheY-like chemotaxis protein